jgi:hypothetical protein
MSIFHCTGGEETETKESHWGDRTLDWTLNQTLDQTRLARSVSGSSSQARDARALHQRVESSPREAAKHARLIRRGGASGHDQPDVSGHEWVLTGNDRTLALWHLVSSCGAFGRWLAGTQLCVTCPSDQLSSASSRLVTVGTW